MGPGPLGRTLCATPESGGALIRHINRNGPLAVVHLAPGRAVEQVARRIGSPTDADKFLGTYERRSEYASYLTAMITPE